MVFSFSKFGFFFFFVFLCYCTCEVMAFGLKNLYSLVFLSAIMVPIVEFSCFKTLGKKVNNIETMACQGERLKCMPANQ